MKVNKFTIFLLGLLIIGTPAFVLGQTDEENFEVFQFNFATPGARASAMGRAFIGLADDASAAVSNPAGLTVLRRPQLYFEYKNTENRVRRLAEADSIYGSLDFATLELGPGTGEASTFRERVNSLSYLNYAQPIGPVTLAFTRHEFLNFEENFVLAPRFFPIGDVNNPTSIGIDFGITGSTDFKGTSYAGSIAYGPASWISLGATFSVDHLEANKINQRYNIQVFNNQLPRQLDELVYTSRTDDSDTQLGMTFGVLLKPADVFSAGFVYSRGATFELNQSYVAGEALPDYVDDPDGLLSSLPRSFEFNVPDRLGFGVAVRPIASDPTRLTLAFDWARIFYSDLADDVKLVNGNALSYPDSPSVQSSAFSIDDESEYHFGGEVRLFGDESPVFARAGLFNNPVHGLAFRSTDEDYLNGLYDTRYNTEYSTPTYEDNPTGVTVGAGIFIKQRVQADVAWVTIDQFDEFVLSVAIVF